LSVTKDNKKLSVQELTLQIYLRLQQEGVTPTKIEYEGPALAIFTKNPEVLIEDPAKISRIATDYKRRLVFRSSPSSRMDTSQAREKILDILASEGINRDQVKIFFDSLRGEVHIYLTGVNGLDFRRLSYLIAKETKWIPKFRSYYSDVPNVLKDIYSSYRKNGAKGRRILSGIGERIFREPVRMSRDIRIMGLGGVQEVGRSAIILETSESKVLIDFGVKVNADGLLDYVPRIDAIDYLINDLDAIILTHAHLDHSGMIPLLYKYGYRGPVYMTEPTLPLSVLLIKDFMEISRKSGYPSLYNINDVKDMIRHAILLRYKQVTDVSPDIKLTFYNAGHILGSAMPHIHIREGVYNILFTGDFKFGRTRLLETAHSDFARVETLVMESTYGAETDKLPSRPEVERRFVEFVNKVYSQKGKILIPTPGVGRSQEMLAVIHHYMKRVDSESKLRIPSDMKIYIDGMIDEANKLHHIYSEYLRSDIHTALRSDDNPFNNENIIPVTNSSRRAEAIEDEDPAIILSTSGMMQGGPVIEYFINLAGSEKNAIVFVSYQAPNTLGRKIVDGAKKVDILYEGRLKTVDISMQVVKFDGFTGHSDRNQLVGFVSRLRSKLGKTFRNVYLVHGEPSKIDSLSRFLTRRVGIYSEGMKLLSTVLLKE